MPIHDWTRVDAGIFHDFHHEWISETKRALNRALAGTGYYALAEQIAGGLGPDVLTLQHPPPKKKKPAKHSSQRPTGGVALAEMPPKVRFRITDVPVWYARTKKAVTIRHISEHRVVSVLEILSPGNKAGQSAITSFTLKAQDLLAAGVHLAVVDLFPPTPRDPQGIHPIILGEDESDTFRFDPDKPLTCASYIGGPGAEAFVEPIAVGDTLPDLPLFLTPLEYVPVPLQATYASAFDAVPEFWREVLTAPREKRRA
jgi:hypothetical protein